MNKTTTLCRYKDKQAKSKRKSWSSGTNRGCLKRDFIVSRGDWL